MWQSRSSKEQAAPSKRTVRLMPAGPLSQRRMCFNDLCQQVGLRVLALWDLGLFGSVWQMEGWRTRFEEEVIRGTERGSH